MTTAGKKTPDRDTATRRSKTDLLDSIHGIANDLLEGGVITKETMRTFDATCLKKPTTLAPTRIAEIRRAANLSQPVFAAFLGTTKSTVAKWESGEKTPSGPSRKLLEVVAKHGIDVLT